MDTHKFCTDCNQLKNIDDFYKSQRGSKCIECKLKITREYKRNKRKNKSYRLLESKKQKERRVRLWMNTLIHDSKYRKTDHTLTVNELRDIFEKQNGLCYWFKIPLIPSEHKKHPQQPSIDRLDRTKGYSKDNVVLCCYSANIGRNDNDLETWTDFIKKLGL